MAATLYSDPPDELSYKVTSSGKQVERKFFVSIRLLSLVSLNYQPRELSRKGFHAFWALSKTVGKTFASIQVFSKRQLH